jgi:DNA (cytosine-5)-methyltransferase 1
LSRVLNAIDLFSGAGGLSCGFERAGGRVVGGIELDEAAAATFEFNHPSARVWSADIRTIDPTEVASALGRIEVVLGGPMCQGVSQRGPRDPYDERNFAFWAFADYVRKLKPDWFMMENVPALASDVHNRKLAIAVFEELSSLGYQLSAEVMNAAWFGVPQLRYRLVVLGSLHHRPMFPPEVAYGVLGEIPEASFTRVGEAIMDLPVVRAGGGVDTCVMPAPRAHSNYARRMRGRTKLLSNHWAADTDPINLDRIRHVREGGNWHDIPLNLLPPRFGHVRMSDHTTTYRRLDRRHPAHTVTTECGNVTSGAFTHPTQNRAITVREAARLQGFPDSFRFIGPRSSQYKQVGNAVPALMAERLISFLVGRDSRSRPGWEGRITLDLLQQYPTDRLPITLAPRYKPLFGKNLERRRSDLAAA